MERAKKPYEILCAAAEHPGHEHFVVTGTLQLLDVGGTPVDYVSGEALQQALRQAYQETLGPVNAARRERFAAIADWRLGPDLVGPLTDAIVAPLSAALGRPGARLLQLCSVALRRELAAMPRELWWTNDVIQRLLLANPDYEKRHPGRRLVRPVSMINQGGRCPQPMGSPFWAAPALGSLHQGLSSDRSLVARSRLRRVGSPPTPPVPYAAHTLR